MVNGASCCSKYYYPSDYRVDEYEVDFKKFEKTYKVDFSKETSGMIWNDVMQTIKVERNMRVSLKIFEYLWKTERVKAKTK